MKTRLFSFGGIGVIESLEILPISISTLLHVRSHERLINL